MSFANIEEEQLHAYVDGQLDAQECGRVEAYLKAHPEAAAMVAEWSAQNAALQALFPAADHSLELPILETATLETANEPRAPLRSPLRALAASVAILAVGMAMGWGGHGIFGSDSGVSKMQSREILVAGLVDQAIAAHVVFTSDSARPVEIGANDEDLLIKWLSNRLGQALTAPDLRVQGYELVGGRLLSSNTGPAAQFMYENAEGTRITVFASRPQDSRMAEFSYQRGAFSGEDRQIGSFYWQDEHLQYAVVGDAPREELSALAVAVYRALS